MIRKGLTKAVKAIKTAVPKKPTVKEQLETLKATIREYFSHIKWRTPGSTAPTITVSCMAPLRTTDRLCRRC